MSKEVFLTILGEPMGKQRPKFSTYNGFVKTYTPEKTQNYENLVKYAYQQNYGEMIFQPHEHIKAHIIAYFGIPKSRFKLYKKTNIIELDKQGKEMLSGEKRPLKKPDLDNIAKVCLDSLNGIAYPDDSQIVELSVEKWYAKEPKVEIILSNVEI